jgi:uncharacterized membrane protein
MMRLSREFMRITRLLTLAAFALVASLTTVAFILLLPLGEGNDETNHVIRTASLLDGRLIGYRRAPPVGEGGPGLMESGFDLSSSYLDAMQYRPRDANGRPKPITRDDAAAQHRLTWGGEIRFVEASNTANYAPFLYVPAALGVAAGRMAQLGPVASIELGRLFNAMFYVAIGSTALAIATRGRLVILTFLLTPMSLFLASCIGQDGPIIALAALASAALGRPTTSAQPSRLHWIGIVSLSLIAIAKPPYLPLAGLVWLAAHRLPTWRWRDALALGLTIALPIMWAGIAAHETAVPFGRDAYSPGPLWAGAPDAIFHGTDAAAQASVLLADPPRVVTLPILTFIAEFDLMCREVVGVLSWRDLPLPVWLYAAWYGVILAVVSLDAVLPATRVRQPWLRAFGAGVGIAACLAGSVLLIYLALYLSWTSVGAALVAGVQGRYFIPLLLFIPLALPWRTRANARLESLAMLIPLALAVVDSAVLPSLILARYYVQ